MFKSGIHKAVLLGYPGSLPLSWSCGDIAWTASPDAEMLRGKALGLADLRLQAPDHR